MPRKKKTEEQNQMSLEKYQLLETIVELKEGAALVSAAPIEGPQDAVRVIGEKFKNIDREIVVAVNVDTKLRPIGYNVCSVGTINSALVSPSNLYKSGILQNSSGIILVHNHVTGDPMPSEEDKEVTARMMKAGAILDIPLHDHIIIGRNGTYYSMREAGYMTEAYSRSGSIVGERSVQYRPSADERIGMLSEKLEKGVKELLDSAKYKEYLKFLSSFHQYSYRNTLLIMQQSHGTATLVKGFRAWQEDGQQVKRGEKAIWIISPMAVKSKKKVVDKNGVEGEEEVSVMKYKATPVFDISQTYHIEGMKEIPNITKVLEGNIENLDGIMEAIGKAATVPVEVGRIEGAANGYYSAEEGKIVVDEDLPDVMKIKTTIHEAVHSILHCPGGEQGDKDVKRSMQEIQAEGTAYVVCSHFGIDTDEYSFGYIASWGREHSIKDLKESLDVIQRTSTMIISSMENAMRIHETEFLKEGNEIKKRFYQKR